MEGLGEAEDISQETATFFSGVQNTETKKACI